MSSGGTYSVGSSSGVNHGYYLSSNGASATTPTGTTAISGNGGGATSPSLLTIEEQIKQVDRIIKVH